MAADNSVDPAGWFAEQIGACEPDLLRRMVETMAEALMSTEADAACGAGYGERSEGRTNRRNGYRERDWDTRPGRWSWRSRNCAVARIFPSGCWNAAVVPNRLWSRWWRPRICWESRPGGWTAGGSARDQRHLQEPGQRDVQGAGRAGGRVPGPGLVLSGGARRPWPLTSAAWGHVRPTGPRLLLRTARRS